MNASWFILLAVLSLILPITLFIRSLGNRLRLSLGAMHENFEALHKHVLLLQERSERTTESAASSIRQELQQGLQANRQELQQGLTQTTQLLEQRVANMDTKLDQKLSAMGDGVQTKLDGHLKEGFRHFEQIQEHLKHAQTQLLQLNTVGQSITDLNNLLKLPHLRGSFGELTLERLLADYLPTDGFELQYRIVPGSTERVDAVIKYPQCLLPIDSKFPREQILPLFDAKSPADLESARKTLHDVMKTLARQIREKYIKPEHGTTDMALLFVPSETLYFEVIRSQSLFEELGRFRVFVVSPNTLAVALHAVSTSRKYYELAKGMEKTVLDIKKAQQHFEHFEKKFADVGMGLGKAQNAFNIASTHLSRYAGAVTRLTGSLNTPDEEAALQATDVPELTPLPELPTE